MDTVVRSKNIVYSYPKSSTKVWSNLPHYHDPLGQIYDALQSSTLIQSLSIGKLLSKEIMKYIPYIESTLDLKNEYTNDCYGSDRDDNEIAHLITMPSECKYKYILKTFIFFCGGQSKIWLKIGKLVDKSKRIDFDNLLYESPNDIIIDGHKAYEVNDINVIFEPGQQYVIEPHCLDQSALGGTGVDSGCFSHGWNNDDKRLMHADFEKIKFVRSDLRWNGYPTCNYYHFRHHLKRFECVFVLSV